jgi:hypothetical protein
MGFEWSRPKVGTDVEPHPPIEIEHQLYIQEHIAYFSCSVDQEGPSDLPICIRGRVSYSGELFPVCTLSYLRCSGVVCIPSCIELIQPPDLDPWARANGFTAIAFEWGSQLREMAPGSFTETRIRSICVPASVASFAGDRPFPASVELVTFERGCQLRRIERQLFECWQEVQVCLPASLEYVNGSEFFRPLWIGAHWFAPFSLEPGNRHLVLVDRTIMNFARTLVIRHFGQESVSTLDPLVEELCPSSFACTAIATLNFPEPSRVRVIGAGAFADCTFLGSITIPSTVHVIGVDAFVNCVMLQEVRIAAGSQLRLIEREAFWYCSFLQPVDVPSATTIEGRFEVFAEIPDVDGSPWRRVRFQTRPPRWRDSGCSGCGCMGARF